MNFFFIKFNVLYLGALFFALLFLGSIMERFRRLLGTGWMWATEYLNGNYILFLYVFLLIVAVISYFYSLWKTWKLTKSDTLFNKTRVLAFGWLLGAPTFIFFTAIYWVSAMQVFVDFLFTLKSWASPLNPLWLHFDMNPHQNSQSALVGDWSRFPYPMRLCVVWVDVCPYLCSFSGSEVFIWIG